jgi:hypothetical protein
LRSGIAQALDRKSVELPLAVVADFSTCPGFDGAREVTATVYAERTVLGLRPGRASALYGVASDIGTTSIVAFLCNLASGRIVGMRTAANPQAIYGEDVISRMTHIQQDIGTLADMRRVLVDEINRLIEGRPAGCGACRHRRRGGRQPSGDAHIRQREPSRSGLGRIFGVGRRRNSRGRGRCTRCRARGCSCFRPLPATSAVTRSRRSSPAARSSTAARSC